jgi:hypothetical protein
MANLEHISSPQLEKGQIIPAFTLPGTDGMPHGPWDDKQREHMVAALPPVKELLETLQYMNTLCAL